MARKEARVFTSIWHDPDFVKLSAMAQRMYLLALSQSELSYCGVVSYTARRWARLAKDTTVKTVESAVKELVAARFLVVDDDTEELWIRSFIKNDACWKNPKMQEAIRRDFAAIHSPSIVECLTNGGYDPGTDPGGDGGGDPGGDGGLAGACAGAAAQHAHTPSPTPSPTPPPPPAPVPAGSANGTSGARAAEEDEDEEVDAEVERRYQAQLDRGASVANPKAWKAKARRNLLADIAAHGRGVLRPPKANPSDPLERTAAAQRARAAQNDARLRGEVCAGCDGTGWQEDTEGVMPCRRCRSVLKVVGE